MKKIFCLVLSVVLITLLCSCSGNTASAIIYYGVTTKPHSLDPQTAESFTELMLVRNIYEGLLRQDTNGKIKNGIATKYNKSNLTYTFYLNEKAVWNDGSHVTADDFVFGITRALDPKTKSPNANLLYSIKNAQKVHGGKSPTSSLGIKAINAHTLQITLEREDKDFLYALTTAPAMPCNRDFFNKSVGKYGMALDTTLSNGSYVLNKWNAEDFAIRITANKDYCGSFVPKNAAVYFSYSKDKTAYQTLQKSSVDIAEITDGDLQSANREKFTTKTMQNKVLVLSIGGGYSRAMRSALHQSAITTSDFNDINKSHTFAQKLLPNIFNEFNAPNINIYNPTAAKNTYNSEIKKLNDNKFPQSTIYYYGDNSTAQILKKIAGHWQETLGAYLNISPLESDSAVKNKTANDKYQISAYSFEINEKNIYNYQNQLKFANTTSFSESYCKNIYLYSELIPIAYYGTIFAYDDCLQNVHFASTNGFIDFSVITKKL